MSLRPPQRSRTRVPGDATGISVSSSALTPLKIAVLAPMPSASERTTTAVHPLACSSMRVAWRRSFSMGILRNRVRASDAFLGSRVGSVVGRPPDDYRFPEPRAPVRSLDLPSPMLNYIWFGLMAISLVVAAFNGTADAVTKGAVDAASTAVTIAIGLIGVMTLWLGMMKIAEAAGLVSILGRALRPVLRWMFPEVPAEHPAAGAIVLAIAANMLGLNNAATPLGIKAMEDMQELNGDKETATNPMVTFMAMTTSGVQLVPSTMIGLLAAAGATNPTAIIAPGLVATFIGTMAAIVAAKLLQ